MPDEEEFATLIEDVREISMPALSVNVDFNDLMADKGEQEAFEIIAKLRDLLG